MIAIIDSDASSSDSNVYSNVKVLRKEREAGAVLLQNHLPLEEDSLGSAGVHLLGFVKHDGVVLQVVVDHQVSNSEILKSALNNAFFEVSEEAENLDNK